MDKLNIFSFMKSRKSYKLRISKRKEEPNFRDVYVNDRETNTRQYCENTDIDSSWQSFMHRQIAKPTTERGTFFRCSTKQKNQNDFLL